jgi:hypothetical protein
MQQLLRADFFLCSLLKPRVSHYYRANLVSHFYLLETRNWNSRFHMLKIYILSVLECEVESAVLQNLKSCEILLSNVGFQTNRRSVGQDVSSDH